MKNNIITTTLLAFIAMLAIFTPETKAQDQGMGDMIFTVGTVKHIGTKEWAWIQWMATDETLLKDRQMDIYMKQGDMTSTNQYILQGSALQITDPRTITVLLSRSAALGDNISNLEIAVDSLYADTNPTNSLSLAEKISAVISGSQQDNYLYKNLVFMGRAHSGISMAIGQGFTCPIYSSGYTTLEIRDHANNEIIGNVTLEAGNPTVLPAPGPIVRVPDTTPKGNLNIKLRWDIPDNLKKVSLMQFGYNLYRMTKTFAVSNGYDVTPPSRTQIATLVSNNAEVVKVNRMPILVDPATVTSNSWFIADDNNAYSGGTPFVDGTKYLYFVSALDILGRDGELSAGFETHPCDRMAPTIPHGIQTRTVSDYVSGVETQWVEVSWLNDTNDSDIARYYVYRYSGLHEMQSNAIYAVSNRISGPILPSPTAKRLTFEDHSLSTNEYGNTYYYTVRSEDNAVCGHNLSGNSAPAFGLMRDWTGPALATGVYVTIQVEAPKCWYTNTTKPTLPGNINLQFTCTRQSGESDIEWAEFSYYFDTYQGAGSESNATIIGKYFFRPHNTKVTAQTTVPGKTGNLLERLGTFFCRVGTKNGKVSNYALTTDHFYNSINFECKYELGSGTNSHGPHIWGYPHISYPTITIPPVNDAKTYRLYRRVDGGKRTLIYQGEMDELSGAIITDYTGGAVNGAKICYYYQLTDQNGNVGPMVFIICFTTEPRADIPTPILAAIESIGTATNNPEMELNWFCPPPGIEKFEIAVAADEGQLPTTFGDSGFTLINNTTNIMDAVVDGVTNTYKFGFYRTGRVGVTFGTAGNPQFLLDSSCTLDREYTIMVRAIGNSGTAGKWSNAETFSWNTVPTPGDPVPWPTRGLPVIQTETFNTNLMPAFLPLDSTEGIFDYSRVGIRIGEIPDGGVLYNNKDYIELNTYYHSPTYYLYTNSVVTNQTVLPCVLYRYQVTNDLYRTASGDVSQVTPLMENIAYSAKIDQHIKIYDPFIAVARKEDRNIPWGIYLLDTQPVVRGARYRYLILRFDENTKEMDRIIPAGEITIP